jgi:hypothetical protein
MTKQSQSHIKPETKVEKPKSKFEFTEANLKEWLLGPFEKQKSTVEDARRKMIKDGVSERLANDCTYWHIHPEEKRARDVLKLVTNEKTGKLWDIPTLQQAGRLSDAQIDQITRGHKQYGNGRVPPYWYVSQIHRVVDGQDKTKSYLMAHCMFEGLAVGQLKGDWRTYEGDRINHAFTLGFYHQPILNATNIMDSDGENKRVLVHNWEAGNWSGNRIYEIPFEVSIFEELLKHAYGPFEEGKISLGIISGNRNYGVKSIEDFTTNDLPGLLKCKEEPQPTYKFDIDPKALADFMKYQQTMKERGEHQYQ